MKRFLLAFALFLPIWVWSQPSITILKGKWKVEGRDSYEVWEEKDRGLTGYAYKMEEGQQTITETLQIGMINGQQVYTAKVPDQNNGAAIPFTMNVEEKELLSFENPNHDFPVKIRYKNIHENRLYVEVLGAEGKGFSYYMDRVE